MGFVKSLFRKLNWKYCIRQAVIELIKGKVKNKDMRHKRGCESETKRYLLVTDIGFRSPVLLLDRSLL